MGIYVWGDNDPYYADANALGSALIGATMSGNDTGDKVVTIPSLNNRSSVADKTLPLGGMVKQDHHITTGIERLYEGITIATVKVGGVPWQA